MITAATAMITVVGEFCDGIGQFCDGLGGFCGGVLTVVSKWSMHVAADCVHPSNMSKYIIYKSDCTS